MSVVGPRPLTQEDVQRLGWHEPPHDWRFSVNPGITGLSQLMAGPAARSTRRLDRLYLQRQSLSLDLRLIALSFAVNLAGKNNVRRWLRAAGPAGNSCSAQLRRHRGPSPTFSTSSTSDTDLSRTRPVDCPRAVPHC
jgi:hypothetical protein